MLLEGGRDTAIVHGRPPCKEVCQLVNYVKGMGKVRTSDFTNYGAFRNNELNTYVRELPDTKRCPISSGNIESAD